MTLSDNENRMIAKLRKRQQQSRRWRIPFAIFWTIQIILWLFILNYVFGLPITDPIIKLTILVYVVPTTFAFIGLASALLGEVLGNWHGKPETDLLLRVIDEIQKKES